MFTVKPFRKFRYNIGLVLCCSLIACSTTPKATNQQTVSEQPILDRALASKTAWPEKRIKPHNIAAGDYKLEKQEPRRFNVKAKNLPASLFFNSLVANSRQNILVSDEIDGEISINLKQVTLLETLKAVRDLYGYDYRMAEYGIQILPNKTKTKIFPINYLNVTRSGISNMSISSGELTHVNNDDDDGENNEEQVTVKSTRVETISKADFWQQLENTLKLLLNDDSSKVVIDSHSGLVIVNAKPAELARIEQYLERAELSVRKQVLIEAKLVEVTLSDGFNSGINWDLLMRDEDPAIGGSLESSAIANINGLSGILSLPFSDNDFAGVLQLLETQGDVKVLSNPRIATVNNQKAVIKVGTDEFFVTEVKNDTTTSNNDIQNSPEVVLTPFFSGIALDVTPQISQTDELILHVHPKITEVKEKVKKFEVSNTDFVLPLAFSSVRETDAIIRAKSGQIVVLGGLIQNKIADDESKIPGLGDIPFLGYLGKQKSKRMERSELVILLQPKIVDAGLSEVEIDQFNNRYRDLQFDEPGLRLYDDER